VPLRMSATRQCSAVLCPPSSIPNRGQGFWSRIRLRPRVKTLDWVRQVSWVTLALSTHPIERWFPHPEHCIQWFRIALSNGLN
jgi:hypothetical protein